MMWEDFFGLHKICILWIFGWISRFFHFFHFSILGLFGFVRGSCGSFFQEGNELDLEDYDYEISDDDDEVGTFTLGKGIDD